MPTATRKLDEGHFFGEMAALRRVRRTATVRALEHTSLLVLDARDLHALMQRQPTIAKRLRETVKDRIGEDLIAAEGDLVTDEFEDTPSRRCRRPKSAEAGLDPGLGQPAHPRPARLRRKIA